MLRKKITHYVLIGRRIKADTTTGFNTTGELSPYVRSHKDIESFEVALNLKYGSDGTSHKIDAWYTGRTETIWFPKLKEWWFKKSTYKNKSA